MFLLKISYSYSLMRHKDLTNLQIPWVKVKKRETTTGNFSLWHPVHLADDDNNLAAIRRIFRPSYWLWLSCILKHSRQKLISLLTHYEIALAILHKQITKQTQMLTFRRAGQMDSWRTGELASWRAGKPRCRTHNQWQTTCFWCCQSGGNFLSACLHRINQMSDGAREPGQGACIPRQFYWVL